MYFTILCTFGTWVIPFLEYSLGAIDASEFIVILFFRFFFQTHDFVYPAGNTSYENTNHLAYPIHRPVSRGVIDTARVMHVILSKKRAISIANLLFATNIDADGTRPPTTFRK